MITLDTNVVSELLRPTPDTRVEKWLSARDGLEMYLTAISDAELRYDVAVMGNRRRSESVAGAIDNILRHDMAGRILPYDSAAAQACAELAATRSRADRPMMQSDYQTAAIAHTHGAPLATRNTAAFEGGDVELINPWNAA